MSVSRQLHELQETDLAVSANEQVQARIRGQLGQSEEAARLRARLAGEERRLEELTGEQRALEWEIEGLSTKIAATEHKLFGGTVRNPKELANLQRESEDLKARRSQLEDRLLELMDRVETTTASVQATATRLADVEAEWREQQRRLTAELEDLKAKHAELLQRRDSQASQVQPEVLEVYQMVRTRKGTAVARVEQGTCRGCQIALPTTDLQQARSGRLVRCGSCGRILYLP